MYTVVDSVPRSPVLLDLSVDLYEDLITANRIGDPEKRMLKVKKRLHDLPEHHFETFRYLAEHLSKVAAKGDTNKVCSIMWAIGRK